LTAFEGVGVGVGVGIGVGVHGTPLLPHPLMPAVRNTTERRRRDRGRTFLIGVTSFEARVG
jgi:hypothetical protein